MSPAIILENLPLFISGLALTLQLLVVSVLLGLALSIPLALLAAAPDKRLAWPVQTFIYIFRGTPLLLQLFVIYYGLSQFDWIKQGPLWPVLREAWWCAVIAFTLNTTAYTAEIFRGAIRQMPKGEIEAASACGMSAYARYRYIILPGALCRAIPMYGNEVIFMLHATALAGVITLVDLFGTARIINSRYYAPFEAFLTAGLFYLGVTFLIVWLFRRLEKHYLRHLDPAHTPGEP